MKTPDLFIALTVTLICAGITIVGGLWHPATVAGAIARFVFSMN